LRIAHAAADAISDVIVRQAVEYRVRKREEPALIAHA